MFLLNTNLHHDQSNCSKQRHLIGNGLQFQRFSPLSSWWEAGQHPGSLGPGGAENSTSLSEGIHEETLFCTGWNLKGHQDGDTLPLQRLHLL